MLVDEGGGLTIDPVDGTIFALPDVSEKGYLDVRVEVNVRGGHSSIPPVHTVRTHISISPVTHLPHIEYERTDS